LKKSSRKAEKTLGIDVGGTPVKVLASAQRELALPNLNEDTASFPDPNPTSFDNSGICGMNLTAPGMLN
jgi:hypothetical protein